MSMWRTEVKLALRAILSRKGYTVLNVVGLAVGVAGCLLILLFLQNELSYDRFHDSAGRIHRVVLDYRVGATSFTSSMVPVPLASTLSSEYPEVVSAVRLYTTLQRSGNVWVQREGRRFREDDFLWTDPEFFDVFSVEFLAGEARKALDRPNCLVLTPAAARKYFGDSDPMGQVLHLTDETPYTVTGVVKAFPADSHFHFDFLASFSTLEKSRDLEWYDVVVYTYILLRPDARPADLQARLPDLSRKHVGPVLEKAMGLPYADFKKAGNRFDFYLQPLTRIHLHSHTSNELEPNGNLTIVLVFAAVAFVILLVACVNFINLSTARSSQRTVEVGIRKVVGSTRIRLARQFMIESILICAVAVLLAVILVGDILPFFNVQLGQGLSTAVVRKWYALPALAGLVLLVGILAGGYPAFLMASTSPAEAIRNRNGSGRSGRRFRRTLVVFQFVTSVVLLVGSLVISSQLDFVRKKPPGFDRKNMVVIQGASRLGAKQKAFKESLRRHPDVLQAAYSDSLQQFFLDTKIFQLEGAAESRDHTLITFSTDPDFLDTYRIRLIEGRFFDRKRPADAETVLLSRAAVRALGVDRPLESSLILMGRKSRPHPIIGVFEDFHVQSLHAPIRPLAVLPLRDQPGDFVSVRVSPGREGKAMAAIEKTWEEFAPGRPMEAVSFEEVFVRDYATEIQTGKVLTAFTLLAVFIACLGLFGLASYTAERRTREIGIRKILGATPSNLVSLMMREFSRWVLAANLIAWPLAYLLMRRWLENFAYRTRIGPVHFLLPLVVSMGVALIAVAWKSVRAALSDPVNSLRYE